MKGFLVVLFSLSSSFLFGQHPKHKFIAEQYHKEEDLKVLRKVDSSLLVTSYIADAAGLLGSYLKMDSNGTFLLYNYNCDGRDTTHRGTWSFEGALHLKSSASSEIYEMVLFRDIVFLVQPKWRRAFIKELRKAQQRARDDAEEQEIVSSSSIRRSMYRLFFFKNL